MANEFCAIGFGNDIDGNYRLIEPDFWTNGIYWIYRDSYYWKISRSQIYWDELNLVARKEYTPGTWVDGHYTGVYGNPSGDVVAGVC